MPGRKYQATNSSKPRYGFNGKENDNEIKGEGNQQDYGMRIYDPRLVRFLSVDPLAGKYPWYTPYQFAGNDMIRNVDLDGGEPKEAGKECGDYGVAPVQDSKDKTTFGWLWDSDTKKWGKGSSLVFKNGTTSSAEALKNDTDGDLISSDNPASPNANITRLNATKTTAELFTKFKLGLVAGTNRVDFGSVGAEMADHFKDGNGVDRVAGSNGFVASEIERDKGFITYAKNFEQKALEYFKVNKTLEGFKGDDYLVNRVQFSGGNPVKGASLFLKTMIGGTQGASAMITKVTATQIKVTYNIYDVFGAGRTDGGRFIFPGLQAMFILQHYRNVDNESQGLYKPFFWRTEVKR
jgi:RHS repeat-associated protein